jgi:hypothetical protein
MWIFGRKKLVTCEMDLEMNVLGRLSGRIWEDIGIEDD